MRHVLKGPVDHYLAPYDRVVRYRSVPSSHDAAFIDQIDDSLKVRPLVVTIADTVDAPSVCCLAAIFSKTTFHLLHGSADGIFTVHVAVCGPSNFLSLSRVSSGTVQQSKRLPDWLFDARCVLYSSTAATKICHTVRTGTFTRAAKEDPRNRL